MGEKPDPKGSSADDQPSEIQSLDTVRLSHAEIAKQLREAGVENPEVDEPPPAPSKTRSVDDD